ncbi:MAG: glycosyltransferase [Rhabdochlamydiaceae bacterium]
MKQNTFVIPIIQPDYLPRMLETLYKYTEKDSFNIIVIDNSQTNEAREKCEKYTHLWIKPYRNLGFAKSMNTGARLTDTKYITFANDDIEFMDSRWWQGIIDTFRSDYKIVAVNPMSPKDATWGYGHTGENHETWEPPKNYAAIEDKMGMVPIINGQPFNYKEQYTPEEYTSLLENHPGWTKDNVLDAIATWCTVIRAEDVIGKNPRIGLFDERFYPGGGEDTDFNARAYSDAWPTGKEELDEDYRWRMVGTSRSWVWHHWGKSMDISARKPDDSLFAKRERWNYVTKLWPKGFDVWGRGTNPDGTRFPYIRDSQIFIDEL